MHKVFVNDKPLIFEDVYGDLKIQNKDYMILSDVEFSLNDLFNKMRKESIAGIIYLCAGPDRVWGEFASRFTLMEAAGGLVKNEKDEFLLIFRRKCWDLPKGKLDYGETPEEAAIREVKEECGLKGVNINQPLINTFHTYLEKNKSILKKTHWYSMMTYNENKLIPQLEEDIEEAKWMSKEKIYKKVFPKTYESIKDVINNYFENNLS